MFAFGIWNHGSVDSLAVEGDGLHTLLGTIRMDGDLVLGLTELTVDGIVGGRLWQTGIDADAVVVGLDAEDELGDGVPHPGGGTREPGVLTLARLEGILAGYHLTVYVRLHLVERLVFLLDV